MYPASEFELFDIRMQSHGYNLGSPRFNTVLCRDFPTARVCYMWNSLSEAVESAPSVDTF